jgi:hypothetical protein
LYTLLDVRYINKLAAIQGPGRSTFPKRACTHRIFASRSLACTLCLTFGTSTNSWPFKTRWRENFLFCPGSLLPVGKQGSRRVSPTAHRKQSKAIESRHDRRCLGPHHRNHPYYQNAAARHRTALDRRDGIRSDRSNRRVTAPAWDRIAAWRHPHALASPRDGMRFTLGSPHGIRT